MDMVDFLNDSSVSIYVKICNVTFIDVFRAGLSGKTGSADAGKLVVPIFAISSIHTWPVPAVVFTIDEVTHRFARCGQIIRMGRTIPRRRHHGVEGVSGSADNCSVVGTHAVDVLHGTVVLAIANAGVCNPWARPLRTYAVLAPLNDVHPRESAPAAQDGSLIHLF